MHGFDDILKICCTKINNIPENNSSIKNRNYNQTVKTVTLNITHTILLHTCNTLINNNTLGHFINAYYENELIVK